MLSIEKAGREIEVYEEAVMKAPKNLLFLKKY